MGPSQNGMDPKLLRGYEKVAQGLEHDNMGPRIK
jgi:hypothetical protein